MLRVSRPRFWIYLAGPYVIGLALGIGGWEDILDPWYAVFLVYFFIPANVLLYGVNDLFDRDTDRSNPKKDGRELRADAVGVDQLRLMVLVSLAISLVLILPLNWALRTIMACFLILSVAYSAPWPRLKSRPWLDFVSNALYILPGMFGYQMVTGDILPLPILLAGVLHTWAMHIYSAVPDIEYDRLAGVRTTPVHIGKRASLILAFGFWTGMSILVLILTHFHPLAWLVLIYPFFPLSALLWPSTDVSRWYWYLPFLNWGLGGLLFLMLMLSSTGLI